MVGGGRIENDDGEEEDDDDVSSVVSSCNDQDRKEFLSTWCPSSFFIPSDSIIDTEIDSLAFSSSNIATQDQNVGDSRSRIIRKENWRSETAKNKQIGCGCGWSEGDALLSISSDDRPHIIDYNASSNRECRHPSPQRCFPSTILQLTDLVDEYLYLFQSASDELSSSPVSFSQALQSSTLFGLNMESTMEVSRFSTSSSEEGYRIDRDPEIAAAIWPQHSSRPAKMYLRRSTDSVIDFNDTATGDCPDFKHKAFTNVDKATQEDLKPEEAKKTEQNKSPLKKGKAWIRRQSNKPLKWRKNKPSKEETFTQEAGNGHDGILDDYTAPESTTGVLPIDENETYNTEPNVAESSNTRATNRETYEAMRLEAHRGIFKRRSDLLNMKKISKFLRDTAHLERLLE